MTSVESSTFLKSISARAYENEKIGVKFTIFSVFGLFLVKTPKKHNKT